MPQLREIPDSRRAARVMRDGAVECAPEAPDVPLTRRALREARASRATSPLPVDSARHPPILRPPAPPALTVQAPSAEPLLPASPARHRVPVRHARPATVFRAGIGASLALAVAGMFVVGSAAAVTAAVAPAPAAVVAEAPAVKALAEVGIDAPTVPLGPTPLTAEPDLSGAGAQAYLPPCADDALTSAIAAGDEAAMFAAIGGTLAFRETVAAGGAPCIRLDDPARSWVVVDKSRPLAPVDYRPADLAVPAGVRALDSGELRQDAAAAMSAMVEASRAAGSGDIGVGSAFRSYETQIATYSSHVSRRGEDGADLVSARPGHSEHQTGLAADVVPCTETCGTIDDLAASPQGVWIAEHAWQYGWIVRYADGGTDVTGYLPEPWHLRYIGVDLAREYHDGGWRTLEEFFGLPPAPHYDH